MRILLASASPRRAELLASDGYRFDVIPADVNESPVAGESPADYVARMAAAKAEAVADDALGRVVLGADTAVVLEDRVFGKPADDAEAAAMLRQLSARAHEVLTGVALRRGDRSADGVERTRVHFVELSGEQIAAYVASGEPRDKAGAYAIQGGASAFVDRIEGSHSNVVGLPLELVRRLLSGLLGGQSGVNPGPRV